MQFHFILTFYSTLCNMSKIFNFLLSYRRVPWCHRFCSVLENTLWGSLLQLWFKQNQIQASAYTYNYIHSETNVSVQTLLQYTKKVLRHLKGTAIFDKTVGRLCFYIIESWFQPWGYNSDQTPLPVPRLPCPKCAQWVDACCELQSYRQHWKVEQGLPTSFVQDCWYFNKQVKLYGERNKVSYDNKCHIIAKNVYYWIF